ncbi:MAG: glycoside hydrolase family 88 protein [Planctomycetota bacterium]
MWRFTLAFGLVCSAVVAAAAELEVPITVEERMGVARTAEPVTFGVPLPKGTREKITEDGKTLVLLNEKGERVPAAFTVVARWYPGESIKWLHVDTVVSAPANGKATYTVATRPPAEQDNLTTLAMKKDGVVTVDTGAVKFTVKEHGFNLFDEVWGGGKQIVASHNGGIKLLSSHMGLKKNKVYTANAYERTKVQIEEKHSKAVIKVTGRHISTDDLPGPKRLFDYKLRIYAYRGSPCVRVVYTFMNKQEDRIHVPLPLDGLVVDLPLKGSGEPEYWMTSEPGYERLVHGSAAEGLFRAYVKVDGSDHCEFKATNGQAVHGRTKSTKTSDLGWAALANETGGVMAGIRRFWQLWPKAVEVDGAGHLKLHLWPNLDGAVHPLPEQDETTKPWNTYWKEGVDYPVEKALHSRLMPGRAHMFPGMSKTHEMIFYFFAKPDPKTMREKWMSLERPLRPVCKPGWYCEETKAFGRLASADKKRYDAETWKLLQGYDERFRDWLDWLLWYRGKEYGHDRGAYDQYGMFDFGDSINWERMKGKYNKPYEAYPVSFHWDNCYYDYPHALMLQFLRTGDLDYFETAVEADHHYIDVDMVCHHPRKDMVGAPRYCPGRMHICQDGKAIYVSNTYNHFKNLAHFDLWFLTGDHHARDRGYLQADFVVRRGRNSLSQARSYGHGIRGALVAYRASGEEKYLRAAQKLVRYNFTRTRSGAWQDGIALEGFRELYEQTGDEKLVETIKNAVDAAYKKGDHAAAILQAYAFIYHKTGDEKYRKTVLSRIPRLARARKMWGSTQSLGNKLRNAPYAFWYLSDALCEKVKTERK